MPDENLFTFSDAQLRQIILSYVNSTVRPLASSLPIYSAGSERPDPLDYGEHFYWTIVQ
jgi:hypothetical protein